MSNTLRITPASIEAFKRAARDLQRAYALGLQESQTLLAKLYGYPDLHALQQHLNTSPPPGPFRGETLEEQVFDVTHYVRTAVRFLELIGNKQPVGRVSIHELQLFDGPETRKAAMDYQSEVDAIIEGSAPAELQTSTSEYVVFEVREEPNLFDSEGNRVAREGIFRLTKRGQCVMDALHWLQGVQECAEPGSVERTAALDALERLANNYPNNPYVNASMVWSAQDLLAADLNAELDEELAADLWPRAQAARALFDGLIPKGFSGAIEPKLTGFGAANEHYFAVLYWGASCAAVLGRDRQALSWARRSLRFHRWDSFGARFIVDELAKELPKAKFSR